MTVQLDTLTRQEVIEAVKSYDATDGLDRGGIWDWARQTAVGYTNPMDSIVVGSGTGHNGLPKMMPSCNQKRSTTPNQPLVWNTNHSNSNKVLFLHFRITMFNDEGVGKYSTT